MSSATSAGWHSIEAIFRCEKEYQLAQVYKVREPVSETPDYFAVGLLLHAAKAAWFKSQFTAPMNEIQQAMQDERKSFDLPCTEKALQYASNLVQQYIDYWSTLPKPTVVDAEYTLGPVSIDGSGADYTKRTARLDDISYYPEGGNKLWIGESKTTSGSINDCIMEYELHGQPLLQYAIWKVADNGEVKYGPVAGVMLDVIQKGYSGKPSHFARVPLIITERSYSWFKDEFLSKAGIAYDIMNHQRLAKRNIYACSRTVGRMRINCPYKNLCKYGESAGINFVFGNTAQPLSEHNRITQPPWEI